MLGGFCSGWSTLFRDLHGIAKMSFLATPLTHASFAA